LFKPLAAITAVVAALTLTGCAPAEQEANPLPVETVEQKDTLVLYSGRSEELIQPLIEMFTAETGIKVEVRYAGSAELAAQILEEGENSPADVFFAQDAGALGAVSKGTLFEFVPTETLAKVDRIYSDIEGYWVGVSGRARILTYNPAKVTELPKSVFELAEPKWKGRIAIAPTNASFQAFVTAMRVLEGDELTSLWLGALKENAVIFEKNGAILDAVDAGQVDAGLINHYYWYAKAKEVGVENMNAQLAAFTPGDLGNMVNVAGAGIVNDNTASRAFLEFLLSAKAQTYFAEQTAEYPLIPGISITEGLTPLSEIKSPDIDLSDLDSLGQTLELIRAAGLL
jgi:iron(III) transport system substrate-binding protein